MNAIALYNSRIGCNKPNQSRQEKAGFYCNVPPQFNNAVVRNYDVKRISFQSRKNLIVAKLWDRLFISETPELLSRVFQVDELLLRGPQPGAKGLAKIRQAKNADIVLSLKLDSKKRNTKLQKEAEKLGMEYHNIPINSFDPGNQQVQKALAVIKKYIKQRKIVYVHCLHGFDRTGMVVAEYRKSVQGWDVQDAFNEMLAMGHEKHRGLFPKIEEYVLRENKKTGNKKQMKLAA